MLINVSKILLFCSFLFTAYSQAAEPIEGKISLYCQGYAYSGNSYLAEIVFSYSQNKVDGLLGSKDLSGVFVKMSGYDDVGNEFYDKTYASGGDTYFYRNELFQLTQDSLESGYAFNSSSSDERIKAEIYINYDINEAHSVLKFQDSLVSISFEYSQCKSEDFSN